MSATRKYPMSDVKILYSKAAGRCSFSSCRKGVVLEGLENGKVKQIGKIAHIVAHSANGPRADSSYSPDKLDRYINWILLCPTCHDTVDAQPSKYTVSDLQRIKSKHEGWVKEQLDQGMSDVTFAELEIAAKAIASGRYSSGDDFEVIPPDEKITKNGLTKTCRDYITMGLSRSSEVGRFIARMAQLDSEYPERLKSGFREKYDKLRVNISGDELFIAMLEFAQAGNREFKQQAAGIAILSHLFHLCEVFEK